MQEKRNFPRFRVMNPVICLRYGRQITMRTQNVSLGGLKLEANLDLRVGESLDFDILTNGTKIHCKGRVLAIENFKDKVQVRLCFSHNSDMNFRKLSDYLHTLYWSRYQNWIIGGILILSTYIAYLFIRTHL